MNAKGILATATLLALGSAQAQLADTAPPRLSAEAETPVEARFGPLSKGFKRYQPMYRGNEAANPNDRLFPGFRTDPRLVLGYAFTPWLALETGYFHLFDQGFHKTNPYDPREAAIAAGELGVKSHTTYLAAKITIPVNERLTAYGKLGLAHSRLKENPGRESGMAAAPGAPGAESPFAGRSSTGAYGAVGAKYRLDDSTTFNGEARFNGSANKFGGASNASGVKGSIGIGF